MTTTAPDGPLAGETQGDEGRGRGDVPTVIGDALHDGGALQGVLGTRLDGFTRRPALIDAVVVAFGLVGAWVFRFSQDDAFISMRYARNLAEGHGLVFNIGDRVEGYTNFLWTLLLSIPFRMGWDPVNFAHLVGLVCFAGTLLALRRIATLVFADAVAPGGNAMALVAVAVFGTSHTVLIYGTGGGLETQLQTAMLTWALLMALRVRSGLAAADGAGGDDGAPGAVRGVLAGCVALSVFAGVALLTRLDSAVYLGALLVLVLASLWAVQRRVGADMLKAAAALALPALLIVLPWLVWKVGFYGSLLPQTLSAKSTPILWAFVRAAMFLAIYFVVTFNLLVVPIVIRHRRAMRATPELRVLRVVAIVWLAYLAVVGADFMEFRFLVAILPIVAVLFASVLLSLESRKVLAYAAIVLVLGSALKWKLMPPATFGIESAYGLASHEDGEAGWRAIGTTLADAFPGGPDSPVSIAVTAAGYIPFYSNLPTVDMLGLNDPGALENSCSLTKLKAGHEQIATPEYLADRNVSLVIGSSRVLPRDAGRSALSMDEVRNVFLEVLAGARRPPGRHHGSGDPARRRQGARRPAGGAQCRGRPGGPGTGLA